MSAILLSGMNKMHGISEHYVIDTVVADIEKGDVLDKQGLAIV